MVITLTSKQVEEHCQSLAARIRAAGFEPMLLIGIQRGGVEVARHLRPFFASSQYGEWQVSRPSTGRRGRGWRRALLQALPLPLCNLLRTVESRVNEYRSLSGKSVRTVGRALPEEIDRILSDAPAARVLLIDDAIDTGATVSHVLQALLAKYPDIEVRVAVISVTTEKPLREADYCLYHDRILCRFPWSSDYRPQ